METYPLYQAHSSNMPWKVVTDQVMGGKSKATMHASEQGVTMQARVSLENNGGFAQIQFAITSKMQPESFTGIYVDWRSDQQRSLDWVLKSSQLWLPWQSYRQSATVQPNWQTLFIPFEAFKPYRTKTTLNLQKINKFSVLAGGEAMDIKLWIREFGFYR